MSVKAAAAVRIEPRLFGAFDTHELVWKRARVEFERQGINLEHVTRIETELKEPESFFSGHGCWEFSVSIEYEDCR